MIPAVRTGDVVHTLDREHGLHHAKESGKKPCAGLKHHSPLEGGVGERAKPAVEPVGGTRRPVSDDQRHYRRQGGGNWLAPPPHQPSPDGLASATPPRGGSDTRVRTGDVVHTLDREHGLHHAKESGKKPCAGLKHHSPLEGESARGRSPQSSRWGGTRRPVSDDQRHYRRQGGGNWLAPFTASAFAIRLGDSPSRGSDWAVGARASRPHPVPLVGAELPCDAAGSHPVGGNSISQDEGEPWRRSRLIQVGETSKAVPGFVRAGRPRSQEAFIPCHRHTRGTKLQKRFGPACR